MTNQQKSLLAKLREYGPITGTFKEIRQALNIPDSVISYDLVALRMLGHIRMDDNRHQHSIEVVDKGE